ncbi:MAG: hypothetical protein IKQ08_08750 [Paludibacteraceae bacterium]|nr:hypothetical protein [Paludibacteraceae bacterium]
MKKSNIMSFIGLTFFTVYEISIYIINPPFDVDFMIFLLCMGSFFTLPIFLFVCCCCIIYSSIFAIIDKKRADIICGIWALVLLLIWIFNTNDVNANIQEEYYEDHKSELWEFASEIERICDGKVSHLWIKKDEDESNHTGNLTDADVEQIKDMINSHGFIDVSYGDSVCNIGYKYKGMALYSFVLGLHGKKLEDNYETIIYNDTVAFEHGCGAVGRCSYPGKEEYLKSKGKTSEY